MGSRKPVIHLRVGDVLLDKLKRIHSVRVMDYKEVESGRSLSFNRLVEECLEGFVWSEKGVSLLRRYAEEIYDQEKAERLKEQEGKMGGVVDEEDYFG